MAETQKGKMNCVRVSKWFLIIVLVFSGVSKLLNPEVTLEALKAFNIFNEMLNLIIVTILPVIEITLACMLIFNYNLKITNSLILVLFIVFLIVSIWGYLSGFDKECGCFGNFVSSKFGLTMIFRNMIFLLIAIHVYLNKNAGPGKLSNQ